MSERYEAIPKSYYGKRNWLKYVQPFTFNIIVNDMRDVKSHKDAKLIRGDSYGTVRSTLYDGGGFRINVPGQ